VNSLSKLLDNIYRVMQNNHPNILWFGNEACREIALTFDDGPHPTDTPKVLDILAKHNIQATFFLVGRYVEQYPALVKQIHQSGHQPGIHCYRHRPFPLEKSIVLRRQLERTQTAIAEICGVSPETIRDLRPPYGAFTRKNISMLESWGYQLVMWNNIPPHWMQPLGWTITQIRDQISPGAIIVLHDGHGHGSKVSSVIDLIVPEMQAQGLRFITIETMRRNQLHGA
jgi:peptidoglycan/xylan/chitin deacetylase (PgdA/CDA1 family)